MRKFWYLTAICLIAIGVYGALNNDWTAGDKDLIDFEKEWTFSADELRDFSVDSSYNVSVKFVKSTDGRNTIHLAGRGTERTAEQAQAAEISGGSLQLDLVRKPARFLNVFNFDFRHNRQQFVISVADGSRFDKLQLKTRSGNVHMDDASILDIAAAKVSANSGNVTIDGFRGGTLDVDVRSGNVKIGQATANLNASTNSGNLTVEDLTGPARLSANSGNVKLYKLDNADADVSTGSGNAYVQVPFGFPGFFDTKAGSGRTRTPEARRETSDSVKVRTGSGNITIEEAKG
ncbi:DUF4097 family beta strand repeat-containing protein [Paenibacillaceae bacterium WGS1546]|uniref:DUF4097 family beta strand repeat-containing protein n=1 Tax=Cohnella sp. WGS1546 TaxID=3366810 RepID=UPI00372CFEB9